MNQCELGIYLPNEHFYFTEMPMPWLCLSVYICVPLSAGDPVLPQCAALQPGSSVGCTRSRRGGAGPTHQCQVRVLDPGSNTPLSYNNVLIYDQGGELLIQSR